jgi:hypothetical protein
MKKSCFSSSHKMGETCSKLVQSYESLVHQMHVNDTSSRIKKFIGILHLFQGRNLKAFYFRFNRKQVFYMIVGH